jgi:hypothetical protein
LNDIFCRLILKKCLSLLLHQSIFVQVPTNANAKQRLIFCDSFGFVAFLSYDSLYSESKFRIFPFETPAEGSVPMCMHLGELGSWSWGRACFLDQRPSAEPLILAPSWVVTAVKTFSPSYFTFVIILLST